MKNKLLLVALAKLLNLDQTVIEAELSKEDGDDSIIKSFKEKYSSYTAEDLAKLIKNSNEKYLETADFDLTKVPKALYSKISAAALEVREKALAKEHGVVDYKDLSDLLGKIAESSKGKGGDEALKQQIETLKGTIKTLESEKETAINDVRTKYESDLVARDFGSALSEIALDYEDSDKEDAPLKKQRKLLSSAFNAEHKIERRNEILIVLGKDGKPITNKLGDPETIANVVKTFATDYGFKLKTPEAGGRGTGSSTSEPTLKGKDFNKHIAEKGIKPLTAEADAEYKVWEAAQK